jgi:ubiquinone/menaquinone biosynthesis C-methylase UbiE
MPDVYTHGHHESVLRSHTSRTVENSAAYLIPQLRSGLAVLDVGCGPGTITLDLAARVAPGSVIGLDASAEVIGEAERRAAAAEGGSRVAFEVGDVYDLRFGDDSFDLVHAHQVLQHLTDPVGALRELRRVVRPDGLVAARDSDYRSFVWAPEVPGLDRWLELYLAVTRANRAEASAGRYLLGWAREAGFADVQASASTWCYADDGSRRWWGDLWATRATESAFAEQAVAYGLATTDELADIAAAWRTWSEQPDGWFALIHGEILARG